jgi:hypothetical protein
LDGSSRVAAQDCAGGCGSLASHNGGARWSLRGGLRNNGGSGRRGVHRSRRGWRNNDSG